MKRKEYFTQLQKNSHPASSVGMTQVWLGPGGPFWAGKRFQQGGAAIQQPKNAFGATCGTRAGLHTAAFMSSGGKSSWGCLWTSAFPTPGPGGDVPQAARGFISAAKCWFGFCWPVVSCGCQGCCGGGTAGTPTYFWELHRSRAACSCLQQSRFALFFYSMHENTL